MVQFCQSCTVYHVLTFLLTFFSYTLLHASRKTFSNVKSTMVAVWTAQNKSLTIVFDGEEWSGHEIFETSYAAEKFLGVLDAIFMFCYATVDLQKQKQLCFIRGLFINGILGDRFDPRLVLAFGMWGSAITNFLFGTLTEWLQFYSIPFYVIIWIVNGFVQSAGWPAEVCIMANWFGRGGRGLILGLWSACASIGNIVGAELAALYTFLVNATLLFCGGFVIFFGLVSKPSQLCLPEPTEEEENVADDASSTTTDEEQDLLGSVTDVKKCNQQKSIPFFKAVLLPGVISYSIAFACLKLVNYSIFFWLPYYLTNNFGWPEHVADHISTWFDWGGIFGGIVGGLISDLIGKRTPVICTQLVFATVALFAYTKSPNDMIINALLMGVAGFFCSGPGNLISAAVSADLGRQKEVANNAQAMSTVTGIVDGTGSVGAAIGQLAIPHLQANLGWNSVFYLFICMISCKDQLRRIFKFVCVCVDIWFIVSLNCFGWREACGLCAVMLEKNGCDGTLLVAALYQRMPSDNHCWLVHVNLFIVSSRFFLSPCPFGWRIFICINFPNRSTSTGCTYIFRDDDLSAYDLHFQSNNVRLFVLNNERQTKSTVSLSTVLVMMMMMMKAAVGIWSILLPVLFRLLVGHCPPPILVKPCVCTSDQSWNKPVDNFGQLLPSVVNVTCQHGKSWSRLRDALRPFRGGRYILHTLHLEKVHDVVTNGRAGGARGLFRNLHIGELLLHDCRLDRWRRDVFINTTVYAISIVGSKLKKISNRIFSRLVNLQEASFAYNQLSNLGSRGLRLGSGELMLLDLQHNQLSGVPRRALLGVGKLEILVLSYNKIHALFKEDFENLPNLLAVELSHNPIIRVAPDTFVPLRALKHVGLAGIGCSDLSAALRYVLERLVSLDISSTSSIELPFLVSVGNASLEALVAQVKSDLSASDLASLTKLVDLDIRGSRHFKLRHLSGTPSLSTVQRLDVSETALTPLTTLAMFPNAKTVFMNHNPTTVLSNRFVKTNSQIRVLHMRHCQIRQISAHAFRPLRDTLDELNLSHNKLRWLNWRALLPLTALRLVDLSYNEFRDRSYYIRGRRSHRLAFPLDRRILPASVEELSLAGNGLHRVPVRCTGRLPELRLAILFQCEIDRTQFEQQPHFSASSESVRRSQQSPALESRLESAAHHRGGGISRPVALFGLDPRPAQANRQRLLGVVETPPPLGPELQRSENDPRQRGNPLDCSCKLLEFVDWLTVNAVTLSTSGTICYTPKSLRYLHPLRDLCWSSCQTDNGTSSTGGDNFRNRDSLHFCKPI
ncbi:Sugar phosphate exchanger 3 [Trichinella murrelli]|uniref:Sugar phosphate exchanger 3 n=1 Tax=Trichinella murrelli TaxID=144512 RepID=A0A0V0U9M1_9BILA|nr:Sugar phosphate exchanger 3 [Trichinella murrelli]